jgi:Ig-fold domain
MNDYIILWTEPKNLEKVPKRTEIEVTNVTLEERNTSILLTLLSNQLVLFVSLVTSFEGNFEENFFLLQRKKLKTVRFHLIDVQSEIDLDKFQQSLQIKHLLS